MSDKQTLSEVTKEIAVDFAFENTIDKTEGYQKVRKQFDEWFASTNYYLPKLKAIEESTSTIDARQVEAGEIWDASIKWYEWNEAIASQKIFYEKAPDKETYLSTLNTK